MSGVCEPGDSTQLGCAKVTERRGKYAIVVTHDRPVEYAACVAAIGGQVDRVVTVAHNCDYPTGPDVVTYGETVPNISTMWNLGLDTIAYLAETAGFGDRYDVAVLNDDVETPPGWFDRVTGMMHRTGAVAGSGDQFNRLRAPIVRTKLGPVERMERMSGFAFILDGTAHLTLDEQFQWWYGDDDLEWRARLAGGVVIVPRASVTHRYPNKSTVGVLAAIAGQDRERFHVKWGQLPH